jgi:hypothetical protein
VKITSLMRSLKALVAVAALALLASGSTPGLSSDVTAVAAANAPSYTEGFSSETIGGQPTTFAPLVGFWAIAADGDNRVLLEDGGRWDMSSTSTSVVEQAQALYGDRYAELLDNVEAYS